MQTVRLLFIAKYRLASACISLHWDHMLVDVDHTVIISPLSKEFLWMVFDKHNIDTSRFEHVNDHDFLPNYPEIQHWLIPGDYRGWWLYQQAIKLSAVDYLDYPCMLIQDPDTFMIKPYQVWNNDVLNLLAIENTTHSRGYYEVLQNALGIERQTSHCFVTEFCACVKQDFVQLKQQLQQRNQCHWLDAIINNVPLESSFRSEFPDEMVKWFSEYELLGNWGMTQRPVSIEFQRRFEFKSLQQLHNIDLDCNAVADAIPFEHSFQMDWDNNQVKDFDHWLTVINSAL